MRQLRSSQGLHLNVAQLPLCLAEVLLRAQHCLMGTTTGIALLQPSPHRASS